MKKLAILTILAAASLALPGIFSGSAQAQDFIDGYGPAIRGAIAGSTGNAGGGSTWEIEIAGRGDVPTDHHGEFWFEGLPPGRAVDAFLKIMDFDGESEAVVLLLILMAADNGDERNDLLVINNGDGSDFMARAASTIGDLTSAGPPVQLIGLLLPAVQKVREAAPDE